MTRPSDSQHKKENLPNCGIYLLGRPKSKTVSENRDKYLDLARELKTFENESDGDAKSIRGARYSHRRIGKETGGIGYKSTSGDHPDSNLIKIDHNTEKCPGNLRRPAVTQTSLEDYQLALV